MAPAHVSGARSVVPDARVYLLDEYGSYGASTRSVTDPYGGDLAGYRDAADAIEEMLGPMFARLESERKTGRS